MLKKIPTALRVVLVILGLVLLAEFIMLMTGHGSLCPTDACQDAEGILPIDKAWIYAAGVMWFLSASTFFLSGNQKWQEVFLGVVTVAGIPFEGALLGHLISRGTPCMVCLLVAGGVAAAILLFWCRSRMVGLLCIAIWVAGMAGGFLVSGPALSQTLDLKNSAVLKIQNEKQPLQTNRQFHLFIRLDCPHCQTVLEALDDADIQKGDWYIHVPGRVSAKDQQRLLFAIKQTDRQSVKSILAAKTIGDDYLPPISPAQASEIESKCQKSFLQQVGIGIKGVPALVIDSPGMRIVLTGAEGILSILNMRKN